MHPLFSKKIFLSIILFLLVIFFYSPIYFGHFAFHNDYRIWEYDHSNFWFGYPESAHLFRIGRPLGMILLNLHLMPIETMRGIWISQWLNVAAIGFFAVCCFYFFQNHLRMSRLSAMLLSFFLISLPAMTINSFWITNLVPCVIPLFFVLAAQNFMQKPKISYIKAGSLLFITLLIYPPATMFFTTLTFCKFLFGELDLQQNNTKKILNEICLVIFLSIFYFIFIKLLKSLLLVTHFAGVDWSQVYRAQNPSFSHYKLKLDFNICSKILQIKDYLTFVFSGWFPLFSWSSILSIMSAFLMLILYAIQSNIYLSALKNPFKTLLGISLVLTMFFISGLPLLAGPSSYPLNYRVTFSTMAIPPIILVFIIERILIKNNNSKIFAISSILTFCLFLMIISVGQHRLYSVVNRLTQEYEKIQTTINAKMTNNIKTINIQRPVVMDDEYWLNADFGLDATSYVMVGQIKAIFKERNQDLQDFQINYGSEFLSDPRAILIPKAEGFSLAPKITKKNIEGTWYYFGNPVSISYDAPNFKITNEVKMSSPVVIKDGNLLYAVDWNCTAKLSNNKKLLFWDNGTIWSR